MSSYRSESSSRSTREVRRCLVEGVTRGSALWGDHDHLLRKGGVCGLTQTLLHLLTEFTFHRPA